jgi:hypothetical protein
MQAPHMKEKTVDEIFREEFLKERAVVLGQSGESVAKAIAKLQRLAQDIEKKQRYLRSLEDRWAGSPNQEGIK